MYGFMYQRLLLLSCRLHNIQRSTRFAFVLDERWHGNYISFVSHFRSILFSLSLSLKHTHILPFTFSRSVIETHIFRSVGCVFVLKQNPHHPCRCRSACTPAYYRNITLFSTHKTRENSHPFVVAHFIVMCMWKDQHPLYRCPIWCTAHTRTHIYVWYVHDGSFSHGC